MKARDLAILLRVSNLPTVWTHAICGWWLAGGGTAAALAVSAAGLSLLYAAGMALNDVWDADRDRLERPERPIPSGRIDRRAAAMLGFGLMTGGLGLIAGVGWIPGVYGLGLAATIWLYTEIHAGSPRAGAAVMGLCRALAVVVGAEAAVPGGSLAAWVAAIATGLYVVAVSRIARDEDRPQRAPVGPMVLVLLWMPPVAGFMLLGLHLERPGLVEGLPHAWSLLPAAGWLVRTHGRLEQDRRRAVGDLLSGLCLTDLAMASLAPPPLAAGFVALFLLCLGLRRTVPAS